MTFLEACLHENLFLEGYCALLHCLLAPQQSCGVQFQKREFKDETLVGTKVNWFLSIFLHLSTVASVLVFQEFGNHLRAGPIIRFCRATTNINSFCKLHHHLERVVLLPFNNARNRQKFSRNVPFYLMHLVEQPSSEKS